MYNIIEQDSDDIINNAIYELENEFDHQETHNMVNYLK